MLAHRLDASDQRAPRVNRLALRLAFDRIQVRVEFVQCQRQTLVRIKIMTKAFDFKGSIQYTGIERERFLG